MADRLKQVGSHLSGNYPSGMFKGEVVIITGAAQGIGKAAALLFAKEGANVVVSDLDGAKAQSVVEEIKAAGGEAIAIGGDVTKVEFPENLISKTVEKYGKINHIVNNAGFTYDKMIHTMDDNTFRLILECHDVAPFRIIRQAAPYFRIKDPTKQENRSIVNVSSTTGLHGNIGQANYAVAKAGVGVFGVRANTVAYGFIATRLTASTNAGETIMVDGKAVKLGIPERKDAKAGVNSMADIPLGRAGTADDAAKAMLFLASPLASYISGHTLEVTGGRGI
ncbi:MAG: Methionine aminopeptidase 1 [Cyphobasidiales sp. Tagirdzhanova-0007]|nr:MAG: Methionine aminopeptidase 1 [Cyphobasidiales sp. Tagirdzhanova-0007]